MVFSIMGKDLRQNYIARMLEEKGHTVKLHKEGDSVKECIKDANVLILPLPVTTDGKTLKNTEITFDEIFENINEKTIIFGGNIPDEINMKSPSSIIDYYKSEKLKAKNAYLTAEAAVALAVLKSSKSLRDCKVLLTGFGRISKCVAYLMKPFCNDVTIALRSRKDMALADAFDFKVIDVSSVESLKEYDIIINTVPARILDKIITTVKEDALVLELASAPFGFNPETAKENNINFEIASSLPGKYSPESAGKEILNCILSYLKI